jgi:hypothetical protein
VTPRAWILAFAFALSAAPATSAAEPRLVDFPEWLDVTELVIPDARWQWQGAFAQSRLVLSWPAPVALPSVHLHGGAPAGVDLLPLLVPEAQLALGPRVDWRLNGALRGVLVQGRRAVSGLAEVLAVGGSDGVGAGFGLGVGLGGAVSLIYRMTFVGGQLRQDLAFDFQVFSLPMSGFLNALERSRRERPPPPIVPPSPVRFIDDPTCDPPGCDGDEEARRRPK